ncbi:MULTISPECIES: class I SAM-dependent methyltransferase [unclassified Roseateles]|uniref:class I SAM-dependent methyltransferase n=1 Tax=unclassified Roseateles TaxID=2626991 RepID=UPI0006FCC55A|nr:MULTISPECIES: class I SAM-dependent methyltransferase [unclassified Roseateles]KQW46444.1 SAM-dependent methyltransferase [Pelomonas sp. Root405]KRA73494.1 SAM-dependent methyltransferase [Pelomonas sp. Root662]
MQALLDAIATAAFPVDAQRLFHGRGGLFPGCEHLALDAYPPALLLTSFEPLADEALTIIGAAITARWPEAPWVYQCRQEGGRTETRLMAGSVPEPHVVAEAGTRYGVHLLRGQNHGLFLDMAEGRRWVREQVKPGDKVLNLFAYTCAFSVVALQAGASEVVNVDMSDGALAIGRRNHALNGVERGAKFLPHDIFNSWGKLTRFGPYDLVIGDPPSFQKGSFVATKDYARLARRLPSLLAPGGMALLCLNTPKLDLAFLHGVMAEHAPELAFVERVANPASFSDASPDRALKVLAYRLP